MSLFTPFRIFFCVLWTVLMISSSFVVLLLTFNRRTSVRMARTMFAPGILWICGVKMSVLGTENLSKTESYVFVCNHLSYLDIPALFRAIPHNLHFVAKKEIKWVPFIGWYMYATGMIFVDRSNRNKAIASLDRAGKLIKKGRDVLMFPEGTRSKSGEIGEFKKGPFMLATKADIAIVPVAISGTEKVLPAGKFTISPSRVSVLIGKPMRMAKGQHINEYIKEVQGEVSKLKEQLTS
jgi:1-acyl-sn-glycerol-3-phosphate acyltransferase